MRVVAGKLNEVAEAVDGGMSEVIVSNRVQETKSGN